MHKYMHKYMHKLFKIIISSHNCSKAEKLSIPLLLTLNQSVPNIIAAIPYSYYIKLY